MSIISRIATHFSSRFNLMIGNERTAERQVIDIAIEKIENAGSKAAKRIFKGELTQLQREFTLKALFCPLLKVEDKSSIIEHPRLKALQNALDKSGVKMEISVSNGGAFGSLVAGDVMIPAKVHAKFSPKQS